MALDGVNPASPQVGVCLLYTSPDRQGDEHPPERLLLGLGEVVEQFLAVGRQDPAIDHVGLGVGLLGQPGIERHGGDLGGREREEPPFVLNDTSVQQCSRPLSLIHI